MSNVEGLRALLQNANVQAFLRVIRAGESHEDNDEAYSSVFGWRPGNGFTFSSFEDHPRRAIKSPFGWTSAAGAYQAMCAVPPLVKTDTWGDFVRWCATHGYRPTFEPADQDLFAAWCINRRGAMPEVIAGRIEDAIRKCAKEWASLPGSPYGQPTITMERALAVFRKWATQAPATPEAPASDPPDAPQPYPDTIPAGEAPDWTPPTPKESTMAPFVIPAVVELAKLIPKLGGMFGGSEVAQRNVAAAGVVVDAVTAAVGAANAQEAVEKIAADPAAREAANKAVEGVWYQITEAGGGGIDGAGKRDAAAAASGDILRSPSFWVAILLLPLVYLLVLSLIGIIGSAAWSDDVRAGLAGSLISAIIGGLVGYYYGQTTSRNRTPS